MSLTKQDLSRMAEEAGIALPVKDLVAWHCHFKVEKRWGDDQRATPYEVVEHEEPRDAFAQAREQ